MTNHLPECRYVVFQQQGQIPEAVIPMGCICPALRACEQRLLTNLVPNLHIADMQGYNRALTAAREAVETLDPLLDIEKHKGGYDCCGCDTPDKLLYDALAAIDALREKP